MRRPARWIVCVIVLGSWDSLAQAEGPAPPAAAGPPAPYVDRLIGNGDLAPLPVEQDETAVTTSGHARSLTVEGSLSQISPSSRTGTGGFHKDQPQSEAGIAISGHYATDNYGTLGIDLGLRRGSTFSGLVGTNRHSGPGVSGTLSDHDLPLDRGWMADAALGVFPAPLIPLARTQPRFFLPSAPLLGATITLADLGPAIHSAADSVPTVNLAVGEPGVLNGLHLTDFNGLGGLEITGGGQIPISDRMSVGIQAIDVIHAVDPYAIDPLAATSDTLPTPKASGRSVLLTGAYNGDAIALDANILWSGVHGVDAVPGPTSASDPWAPRDGSDFGAWIDASYRSGRAFHSAGVYYLRPDLAWGTAPILNDAYGAYYRFNLANQRWRWLVNVDASHSIDRLSESGAIANADARRQISLKTAIGVNGSVRVANGAAAGQILAYTELQSRLGSSRGEIGWTRDDGSHLYHVSVTQNWSLPSWAPSGSRLSTQVSYDRSGILPGGRDRIGPSDSGHSGSFGIAVSAAADVYAGISVDATIAYNSSSDTSLSALDQAASLGGWSSSSATLQGQAVSATVSVNARLSQHWMLTGSFTDAQTSLYSRYGLTQAITSPLGLTPAQIEEDEHSRFRLLTGYIALRYAISAGHDSGAIGRHEFAGGGSGTLKGHVFFDANGNGRQDPAEAGVSGIIVYLDGILATRTDASGYYRFDTVADGHHRVTVSADMLPLPWMIRGSIATNGQRIENSDYMADVEVALRSTTVLDIPAER
jgi:hypothetical protein